MVHHVLKDAYAVGADTVKHLVHTYSLDLFGLSRPLNKDLGMKVVVVSRNVLVCLTQQQHDVKTLLELLRWKMALQNVEAKFVKTQHTHVLVCFAVMGGHSRQFIENVAKVVSDLTLD